jgi:hypothetical protein
MGSFANQIRLAVHETSSVPAGACRTCERGGMPVLLLRQAPLPPSADFNPDRDRHHIDVQSDRHRMLREGYVYVLLDQEIWHAYQVNAQGHLRQYDPYRMPKGPAKPLSKACTTEGHDIRASFIHVDTKQHKEAWIAFSHDRWPEPVLDAYKSQRAPSSRFLKVDLAALRDTPNTLGHGLTYADGFLTDRVWEYRYDARDFGSRHGLHLRTHRLVPLNDYVDNAARTHALPQGVPVLVLPDPVGTVLELNQQRQILIQDRLAWAGNAERQYLLFTSAALLQIKELEKSWAQGQAQQEVEKEIEYRKQHNDHPVLGTHTHLPPVDVARETEIVARRITTEYHERLEQRYNEPLRLRFQQEHDKEWQRRQALIDTVGKRYAEWLLSDSWQRIAEHDYSAADSYSAASFTKMVAACLDGGPSEAPVANDSTDLGPTQKLWKALLENPDSVLYKAMLAKNDSLLAGLKPNFTEGFQANDSGKLYAAAKDVLGSLEGEIYLRASVSEAIGLLQGALNNAFLGLDAQVKEQLRPVVTALHQTSLLLCSQMQMILVEIELTLGEYQELLTQQMREAFDKAAQPASKKVRAMIFSGMIALPGPAQKQIFKASFWIADTAEGLKNKLAAMATGASATVDGGWRRIVVGIESLEPQARAIAGELRATAVDAKLRANQAFAGLRGLASLDLALSMGALFFQQDGLERSVKELERTIGAKYPEAVAGVAASAVGVLGVGVELTGVGIKRMALALQKAGLAEAQALNALVLGKGMIRFGGVTSALAGIVEGVQSGFAASRTGRKGDSTARIYHYVAAGISTASAVFAGIAAYVGTASLLGPLGCAIALGLLAYTASEYAKKNQSTSIEQWARRCYFGKHDETPPVWWNSAKTLPTIPVHVNSSIGLEKSGQARADMDVAIGALNAALLGVVVDFGFYFRPRLALAPIEGTGMQWGTTLEYSVQFPSWRPEHSGYAMSVALQRYLPEQIVIAEQHNTPAIATVSAGPKRPGFRIDSGASQRPTSERPVIAGCLLLDIAEADIEAATFRIKYWPNIEDKEGYAEIMINIPR